MVPRTSGFRRRTQRYFLASLMTLVFAAGYLTASLVGSDRGPSTAREERRPSSAAETEGPSERHRSRLRSLSYALATYDPNTEAAGVTLFQEDKAFQGLSFYSSRDLPAAFLIDMNGQILHRWARREVGPWQHVDLFPNGDVLAVVKYVELLKLDLQSNLIWRYKGTVHHDDWITKDGRIFLLTERREIVPRLDPELRWRVDYVTILSEDGELVEEISLLDLLIRSPYRFLLPSPREIRALDDPGKPVELLHANHIEVFDGSRADRWPLLAKDLVLLSLREINTIMIADLKLRKILWLWGAGHINIFHQHHPTLLDNGHILLFNNGWDRSEILELDPRTYNITWEYSAGVDFFSRTRGSNQRLPNGNTLITESDTGYVFEITADGETVWEFANPRINEKGERSAIWRMVRFRRQDLPFLDQLRIKR